MGMALTSIYKNRSRRFKVRRLTLAKIIPLSDHSEFVATISKSVPEPSKLFLAALARLSATALDLLHGRLPAK